MVVRARVVVLAQPPRPRPRTELGRLEQTNWLNHDHDHEPVWSNWLQKNWLDHDDQTTTTTTTTTNGTGLPATNKLFPEPRSQPRPVFKQLRNGLEIDVGASLAPEKNKVCFKNEALKVIIPKLSTVYG